VQKIPPVSVDAGFSPQTAKPKTIAATFAGNGGAVHVDQQDGCPFSRRHRFGGRSNRDGREMRCDYRQWLEYDSVALAVLLVGIGFVELIVLSF
jgi:hypothetical protein